MQASYDPHSYDPSNFDEDMCLKPPLLLWLAVLFLCRGIVLPLGVGIGHVAGLDAGAMTALRAFWRVDELVPALFAVPILYALFRRTAKASRSTRWLWAHGRSFLALSAAVDAALSVYSMMSRDLDDSAAAVCAVVADLYFLFYVLKARRVRDTFSDFPLPESP
jgi:hypothetical protein